MYPSAEYRLAVVTHLAARAACGCTTADCPVHGAYDPDNVVAMKTINDRGRINPPELITVDGREPSWPDFAQVARNNPTVHNAMTALELGGYRSESHALQCIIIALDKTIRAMHAELLRVHQESTQPAVAPDLDTGELDAGSA